jgi:uncharacterized OB-fold protein
VTVNERAPLDMPVPDLAGWQPSRQHWAYLEDHELRIQVCASCRRSRTPATDVCPHCHSTDVEWERVDPAGTIYTWSRVWHAANPSLADRVPYVLVWVEIDHPDRPRFLGNLLGDPEQPLAIGDAVVGVFQDAPGGTVLNWMRR